MNKGYKKIFWGMLLSILHINLGYIRILPPFIAYLIIASGCKCLNEEIVVNSFQKAKIYCKIFAFLSVVGTMFGNVIEGTEKVLLWYNLCSIVQLIIVSNIFQGSKEAFRIFNNDNNNIQQYKREFNILIIYYVVATVIRNLNMILNNKILNVVVITILLICEICFLFLIVRLCKIDFEKKKVIIDTKRQL